MFLPLVILIVVLLVVPTLAYEVWHSDVRGNLKEKRQNRAIARKNAAVEKVTANNYSALSWPARKIMKSFDDLPVNSRPDVSILEVLKALDIKHGVSDVNQHFCSRPARRDHRRNRTLPAVYSFRDTYHSEGRNYSCDSWGKGCIGAEYNRFYREILAIHKALADREYALKLEGVAHHLDAIADAHARMKQEAVIIKSVTAENVRRELN